MCIILKFFIYCYRNLKIVLVLFCFDYRKIVCFGYDKVSRIRVIWGKIIRLYGNSGVVRVKFRKNFFLIVMGKRIRVVSFDLDL